LNAAYLAELESRLETSDDRVEDLTRQIAELEQEAKQQGEQAVRTSDNHRDVNELRRLRVTIEEKDSRILDLQRELGRALKERVISQGDPQDPRNGQYFATRADHTEEADLSTKVPGSPAPKEENHFAIVRESTDQNEGENSSLRKEHVKTLAELTAMTEQYQKALADITRLSSQLEETSRQEATFAPGDADEQLQAKGLPLMPSDASNEIPVDGERKKEDGTHGKMEPGLKQDFPMGRGQSRIPSSRYVVHVGRWNLR
jgi:hypothetical protein